jgi:hypothetical protein
MLGFLKINSEDALYPQSPAERNSDDLTDPIGKGPIRQTQKSVN